ncbi:hypothetical protein CRG98_037374, partial [Punica granatum]
MRLLSSSMRGEFPWSIPPSSSSMVIPGRPGPGKSKLNHRNTLIRLWNFPTPSPPPSAAVSAIRHTRRSQPNLTLLHASNGKGGGNEERERVSKILEPTK